MSIVEHGINRIKHASDCMAVLLKELKLNSEKGNCRLLVVADHVNAFYEPSNLLFPDRTCATVDDITIARAFKKFFNKEWVFVIYFLLSVLTSAFYILTAQRSSNSHCRQKASCTIPNTAHSWFKEE